MGLNTLRASVPAIILLTPDLFKNMGAHTIRKLQTRKTCMRLAKSFYVDFASSFLGSGTGIGSLFGFPKWPRWVDHQTATGTQMARPTPR
jgi:hypothetical protein